MMATTRSYRQHLDCTEAGSSLPAAPLPWHAAVNFAGSVRVINAFSRHLVERDGGTIITVSSGSIGFLLFRGGRSTGQVFVGWIQLAW